MWTGSLFGRLQGRCTTQPPMPPDRMEAEIWMKMDQSHLNTLIVPVYWETLEPEEGSYDFSLVDSLLEQAVRFKKKLILLWFGLWKNAESAYVPAWMKQDSETFFRAEMYGGERLNTISPLCWEAVERDAAAFSRLMGHLREVDKNSSVIMVQVENEVGLLGTERDYCRQAEEAFTGNVPDKLMDAAVKSGKSVPGKQDGLRRQTGLSYSEKTQGRFFPHGFLPPLWRGLHQSEKKSILCPATPMCG